MIECPHWSPLGDNDKVGRCAIGQCGPFPTQNYCRDVCPKRTAAEMPRGPGTELKRILAIFGIVAEEGCRCNEMAARMDRGGPAWCRAHREEIVDVMRDEAARRGLPFSTLVARGMIRRAIGCCPDPPA